MLQYQLNLSFKISPPNSCVQKSKPGKNLTRSYHVGSSYKQIHQKERLLALALHKQKSSNSDKDGEYSESINKESSPYAKKKRTSRCHESEWFDCDLTDVENLPCNIDDTCIYQLQFDMTQHMWSILDETWKTWVTSSRKGFSGIIKTPPAQEVFNV